MNRITAVVHTHNDGLRLGRCLETLYPCDEIVIIDHGSRDATLRIAQEYAGQVLGPHSGQAMADYISRKGPKWILCLAATESLTESLAASLYEWKLGADRAHRGFSMRLREETPGGWVQHREPQTRMVPADWRQWNGPFPVHAPLAQTLDGEILRFFLP